MIGTLKKRLGGAKTTEWELASDAIRVVSTGIPDDASVAQKEEFSERVLALFYMHDNVNKVDMRKMIPIVLTASKGIYDVLDHWIGENRELIGILKILSDAQRLATTVYHQITGNSSKSQHSSILHDAATTASLSILPSIVRQFGETPEEIIGALTAASQDDWTLLDARLQKKRDDLRVDLLKIHESGCEHRPILRRIIQHMASIYNFGNMVPDRQYYLELILAGRISVCDDKLTEVADAADKGSWEDFDDWVEADIRATTDAFWNN